MINRGTIGLIDIQNTAKFTIIIKLFLMIRKLILAPNPNTHTLCQSMKSPNQALPIFCILPIKINKFATAEIILLIIVGTMSYGITIMSGSTYLCFDKRCQYIID